MNLWKKPLLLVMEKLDAVTCVSDRTKLSFACLDRKLSITILYCKHAMIERGVEFFLYKESKGSEKFAY
jgi:hypothetical protein